MEIVYVYTKKRKEFGRHTGHFADRDARVEIEIAPNEELKDQYMEKNPCVLEMHCIASISEHAANTNVTEFNDRGMYHEEGGWPRDIDPTEPEHKIRFTKKVEKDEEYIATIANLSKTIDHAMRQNTALDIYEEYFADSYTSMSMEPPAAKTTHVFRDPSPFKRCATSVSWIPDKNDRIAVSYSILGFQATPEGMSTASYVWNLENPNYPEQDLMPQSPLCCLEYNNKDHNILVGGSYNGLVAYWDVRGGSQPVDTSPIEKSHRDPVYQISWLQSKTGTECASVSTDGQVLWWDTRKLGEPTETLPLIPKGADADQQLGGVSLEYGEVGGPTKFMVGTEQGIVLMCNRKAKNPADRIGTAYVGHHGPVYSIQRNPFFPKFFLTIGDWTARIWMEDIKTPVMTTKYHGEYLTAGCWSPSRPGVFFTTKDSGELDIWDFAFKQNTPTLPGIKVSDAALQSIRVTAKGLVAVGAADGSTTVLEISDSLAQAQSTEKSSIMQMLDREMKREKNLEARAKELKQKAKKEAAAKKEQSTEEAHDANADMPEVEKAFFEQVGLSADGEAGDAPEDEEEGGEAEA